VPYRNDLVILGLLLGAVGSGLLVRSGIWRPTLSKEAATFVGTNPYIVKAAAFLRWDYVIGFSWCGFRKLWPHLFRKFWPPEALR